MKSNKGLLGNKKYRLIVETARDLFMRYGIRRVTVEEICKTAGVSKMTFYKHFKNKLDLALFILNDIFEEGINRYKRIMDQDVPYSEKAKEIIRLKLESSKDVSQEMLKDLLSSSIPEVADLMTKITRENLQLFLDDMIAAQKKGEIRQDINPHFITYMLGQMQEMATDEKLLNMYESTQALTSEIINFFFYGIL
ncbi:MAG: TetR/AcrR family transcriptional regulator [Candidatus Aminicenantes bacterium]|nr:MAG: TetR/AcrR family transcriptional regulator [Candidatus Aminicenantes bacterium]